MSRRASKFMQRRMRAIASARRGKRALRVDNFACGGGASTGIEAALGVPMDYAVNHDPLALAMHRVNHPRTKHLCEDVFDVDPYLLMLEANGYFDFGWFSPDCTYFSPAKGGAVFLDHHRSRRRRGLAGIIPRWLKATGMRVFMMENVSAFSDWCPLDKATGKPDWTKRGSSYRRWIRRIENTISSQTGLPYRLDMRELAACDYGAPTTRNRLFIIGRCDGGEIVFPAATHGPWNGCSPYRTASECIDWSIPCTSIFEREALGKKPLVDATLRRIARSVVRHCIEEPNPFIAPIAPSASDHHLAVAALINTRNGERVGQSPRIHSIREPYPTVTAQGSQGALVLACLARHYGGSFQNDGASLKRPMPTITAKDHHALVTAFLIAYYGNEQHGRRLTDPLGTVVTKDRFALVTVHGAPYYIHDIQTRHLVPRELYNANSFPPDYVIDHGVTESGERIRLSGKTQVANVGNSVPPVVAEALVRANYSEHLEEMAA